MVGDHDQPKLLVELGLRPSEVITRERNVTQAWARCLFEGGRFAGARWWSHSDPRWSSLGLWNLAGLRLVEVFAAGAG